MDSANDGVTFLSTSTGMCRECRKLVEARYISVNNRVYLQRLCPTHGEHRALVAESLAWFLDAQRFPSQSRAPEKTVPRTGHCPTSCGPCGLHGQRCHLPVFSITNACNLRCPICFTYNRTDRIYHMSEEEFARNIAFVIEATGGVDLVNITGGEPTLHPDLPRLLAHARRPEIGRVTVNTNGLKLGRDETLARALKDQGVYVILSLDTLDRARSVRIHGRDIVDDKHRALDMLARHDIPTTLLMVLAGDVNDDEAGAILDLALTRDHVRSLTIQAMTFTGQGGGQFQPRTHVPVDGIERLLEEQSAGRVRRSHFVPMPVTHPLCYGVAYFLQGANACCSLTDIVPREDLAAQLSDGYLVHPTAALEESLRNRIDELYAHNARPDVLRAMKDLLRAAYPPGENLTIAERQRRAEKAIKTIYIHAHMDEDTWEVGRARRCPDQVPVDASRLIGACNYNLFYRMQDERFWAPEPPC